MTSQQTIPNLTFGLDLGDKVSQTCEIDAAGQVVKRAAVATTPGAIERYFGGRPPCRVAFEVSTHSPWVSRQLKAMGHETVVSNTSKVYVRPRRKRRNDRIDAEFHLALYRVVEPWIKTELGEETFSLHRQNPARGTEGDGGFRELSFPRQAGPAVVLARDPDWAFIIHVRARTTGT